MKSAVFIGVMRDRASITLEPATEGSQGLLGRVVFGEPGPELTRCIIDQGNQLTVACAVLLRPKGGAILHYQLSKTGSSLTPHMNLFHPLLSRMPEARLRHPLP